MANAIYPKFKEQALQAGVNLATGTVRVGLVDTGTYTYSAAHEYFSSMAGSLVGNPQTLNNKTVTNGIFDADDVTFPSVVGVNAEALAIWIDTGDNNTSRLVLFMDTGVTGLPVLPNGGDIVVVWDNGANKIFAL
jgi:hypothetical protein